MILVVVVTVLLAVVGGRWVDGYPAIRAVLSPKAVTARHLTIGAASFSAANARL